MIGKLFKLIVVLVLLLVIGVVVLFFYIDRLAKRAVEEGGTYALGVATTVDNADVKPIAGEFTMSGLNVANPAGYDSPHFLDLNSGEVAVKLGSLRQDTVELPHLRLSGLDMNLQKKEGKSNYQVILDNLKKLESGEKSEPAPGAKKYVIREVEIRDVMVHVDLLPVGGSLTRTDVPIESIVLHDVGSGGKPVKLSDLSGVIVKAVFAAVAQKGTSLPGDIGQELTKGLASLGDLKQFGAEFTGKALEGIGKGAEDVLKGAEEEIQKGIGDALKGLGGQKKDE